MAKCKVIHLKNVCIGCGACAAVCPEHWTMDQDEEGLSTLKDGKQVGENFEKEIDSEDDCAANQEAADVCPVQAIKLERK